MNFKDFHFQVQDKHLKTTLKLNKPYAPDVTNYENLYQNAMNALSCPY